MQYLVLISRSYFLAFNIIVFKFCWYSNFADLVGFNADQKQVV